MTDAASLPPTTAAALQQTAPATQQAEALAAVLTEGPEALLSASRPIQIPGTVLDLTATGLLTLRTAAGPVTLALQDDGSSSACKDFIQRTLEAFFTPSSQTETSGKAAALKPLLLALAPAPDGGAPLARLFLPKEALAATPLATTKAENALPLAAPIEKGAWSEGKTLAVTILPRLSETPALLPEKEARPFFFEAPDTTFELMTKTLSVLAQKVAASVHETEGLPLPRQEAPHPEKASLRIDAVLPDTDVDTPPAPEQIKATLVAKTPSGHALLQSGEHILYVREKTSLPVGATLLATLLPEEAEPQLPLPAPDEKERAALQDLLKALTLRDPAAPAASQAAPQTPLPQATQHLGGTLLFFLSALQGGKMEEWLGGSALEKIEKSGKRGIVEKALQTLEDGADIAATDDRGGLWRSWTIPIQSGAVCDLVHLYVRKKRTGDNASETNPKGEAAKQTRFVISMTMSRLGPMQMDGLSRPQRLDLVLRSEAPLPTALPAELTTTYIHTLEALGLAGTLSFQDSRQDWLNFKRTASPPELVG